MVGLPAGTFEGHAIGSFCLDATAVTTRDYTRWCKAQTGETRKACEPATGTYYNWEVPGREDHPINGVNWDQANAYCRARVSGTRLPTEWEREWAARGDARGWTYPWGTDDPSPLLPVCWDGGSDLAKGARQSTCPVRQHPRGATPEGLFGLAGNVWEWTDSWWDEKTKSARVVRGGSWNYMDAAILRAGARTNYAPGYRYFYLGFRCARTAGR